MKYVVDECRDDTGALRDILDRIANDGGAFQGPAQG